MVRNNLIPMRNFINVRNKKVCFSATLSKNIFCSLIVSCFKDFFSYILFNTDTVITYQKISALKEPRAAYRRTVGGNKYPCDESMDAAKTPFSPKKNTLK